MRWKPLLLRSALSLSMVVPLLSCGNGDDPGITITPKDSELLAGQHAGLPQVVLLTATYLNGQKPTSVQWSSSEACIWVPQGPTDPEVAVGCNDTCPYGTKTATITAQVGKSTAKAKVTCTWY